MFQYGIPGVKPLARKPLSMQMLIGKLCGSGFLRGDLVSSKTLYTGLALPRSLKTREAALRSLVLEHPAGRV